MAARLEAPRAGVRPVTVTAPARRAGLAWPRLPAVAELATIGAGYLGYALVRLAIHADGQAAFAHAAQLWQAERRLHLRTGPWLNGLAAARPRARRGGRALPRAAALSGHSGGPGLAVLAQARGVRPAALGAAGHDRREHGVLGLDGRPPGSRFRG